MAASNRRVGIVGVGFGSAVYVPAFASEGFEVVAICSRHRDKARSAADVAGIRDVHTDAMEMIARDDIDAIGIASPPATHYPLSIAALRAGKHVLCEKPFALNAVQAAEMRDAARASGRTAMVGHEFRHTPQRAYVKELLDGGYIGRFQLCTIELFLDRYVTREPRPLTWLARESEGGGLLGALGSHYIDALRHWFGEVASVSGRLLMLRPELLELSPDADGPLAVAERGYFGTDQLLLLRLPDGATLQARVPAWLELAPGERVRVSVRGAVVAFPRA